MRLLFALRARFVSIVHCSGLRPDMYDNFNRFSYKILFIAVQRIVFGLAGFEYEYDVVREHNLNVWPFSPPNAMLLLSFGIFCLYWMVYFAPTVCNKFHIRDYAAKDTNKDKEANQKNFKWCCRRKLLTPRRSSARVYSVTGMFSHSRSQKQKNAKLAAFNCMESVNMV